MNAVVMDIITREIEERFAMDSFRQICNAEDLLIPAATRKPHKRMVTRFWTFLHECERHGGTQSDLRRDTVISDICESQQFATRTVQPGAVCAGPKDNMDCDKTDIIGLEQQRLFYNKLYGDMSFKKSRQVKMLASVTSSCDLIA